VADGADPADRSRHHRRYPPRRATQSYRDRNAAVLAHVRSAYGDAAAYVDRATTNLNTSRTNQHADGCQHVNTYLAANAHRDVLSHTHSLADSHRDSLADND
jgi:hypothetical protein